LIVATSCRASEISFNSSVGVGMAAREGA
jgi:hypothetical protein